MKYLLLAALLSLAGCSKSIDDKLAGEWTATDDTGDHGSMIFEKDHHVTLTMGNTVVGGASFEANGKKGECKYEVDESKTPMWLDLLVYVDGSKTEPTRLKGIARFVTDTKLQYRLSLVGDRDTTFDAADAKNTLLLEKRGE